MRSFILGLAISSLVSCQTPTGASAPSSKGSADLIKKRAIGCNIVGLRSYSYIYSVPGQKKVIFDRFKREQKYVSPEKFDELYAFIISSEEWKNRNQPILVTPEYARNFNNFMTDLTENKNHGIKPRRYQKSDFETSGGYPIFAGGPSYVSITCGDEVVTFYADNVPKSWKEKLVAFGSEY